MSTCVITCIVLYRSSSAQVHAFEAYSPWYMYLQPKCPYLKHLWRWPSHCKNAQHGRPTDEV